MPFVGTSPAAEISNGLLAGYKVGSDISAQRTALAQRQQALDQQKAQDEELHTLRLANLHLARLAEGRAKDTHDEWLANRPVRDQQNQDSLEASAIERDTARLANRVTGANAEVAEGTVKTRIDDARNNSLVIGAEAAVAQGTSGARIESAKFNLDRAKVGAARDDSQYAAEVAGAANAVGTKLSSWRQMFSRDPDALGQIANYERFLQGNADRDPASVLHLAQSLDAIGISLQAGAYNRHVDQSRRTVDKWAKNGTVPDEVAQQILESLDNPTTLAQGMEMFERRRELLNNETADGLISERNLKTLIGWHATLDEKIRTSANGVPNAFQHNAGFALDDAIAQLQNDHLTREQQRDVMDAAAKAMQEPTGPDPRMESWAKMAGDASKSRTYWDNFAKAQAATGGGAGSAPVQGGATARSGSLPPELLAQARQFVASGEMDKEQATAWVYEQMGTGGGQAPASAPASAAPATPAARPAAEPSTLDVPPAKKPDDEPGNPQKDLSSADFPEEQPAQPHGRRGISIKPEHTVNKENTKRDDMARAGTLTRLAEEKRVRLASEFNAKVMVTAGKDLSWLSAEDKARLERLKGGAGMIDRESVEFGAMENERAEFLDKLKRLRAEFLSKRDAEDKRKREKGGK